MACPLVAGATFSRVYGQGAAQPGAAQPSPAVEHKA